MSDKIPTDEKISLHVAKVAGSTIEKFMAEVRSSVGELQPLAGQDFLDLMFKALLEIDLQVLINTFDKIGMHDNAKNRQRFFNAYIKMLIKGTKAVANLDKDALIKINIKH